MNEYIKDTIMVGVCAAAVFVIGVLCGMRVKNRDIKREAIAQGYAIYNPTNGNFQWKEAK